MTFMDHAQTIEVPSQGSLTFSVKPGALADVVALKFAVENALVTPDQTANIEFDVEL